MYYFEKLVQFLSLIFNWIASGAIFVMIILTSMDVMMRYFFNRPITGTYDIVCLLGVVVAAFAMPYTMLMKGHVAVEILLKNLSKGKQVTIETITHIVGITLFLILFWQCLVLAWDMKAAGEVTSTLLLPFHPIVYCMAVCFFLLSISILVNLFNILKKR